MKYTPHGAIQKAINDLWNQKELSKTITGGLRYTKTPVKQEMPFCVLDMDSLERDTTCRTGNRITDVMVGLPTFTVYHVNRVKGLEEAGQFVKAIKDVYENNPLVIDGGCFMHMRYENDGGDASDDGNYEWMWEIQFEVKASFTRTQPALV